MKYCPITYELIEAQVDYSERGLKLLSAQLKHLAVLPLSAAEQRQEALARATKMSIQGLQPKISARLKVKTGEFEFVDIGGTYILKPASLDYPELPENEAITMKLAETIGLDVPVHGLLYSKDGNMTYFIKRFDRIGHGHKVATEDFSQLSGLSRDTKYHSSMEKVVKFIQQYCTFPKLDAVNLLKQVLFNFLVGNEDMHLKNLSLITVNKKIVQLSPVYDLLNTTIVLKNAKEEIALPLNGRKNNLRRQDFIDYFAIQQLELNSSIIEETLAIIQQAYSQWEILLRKSFLSKPLQDKYLTLLDTRFRRLMS